jgi:hypothetical protein
MCRSAHTLLQAQAVSLPRYLMTGDMKRVDLVLVDAIVDAVAEARPEGKASISVLRRTEHTVRNARRDLLDFYYASANVAPHAREWTSRSFAFNRNIGRDYARAYWTRSRFFFFCDIVMPVGLTATCRLPPGSSAGADVSIAVNGHPQLSTPIDARWQTLSLVVPEADVREGLNEVVIEWPEGQRDHGAMLDQLAEELIVGATPDFHEVFGEIRALVAFDPSHGPWRSDGAELRG